MKYILRRKILDSSFETTISKERFHQLLQAREGLFELLAIEEKYDLLIRSYLNFEKVINETTLNSLMITDSSWSDFIEHIQSANLAMMSLLTMCRSYIDHIPQHLESAFPNSTFEVESFDKVRKEVHAEILGYRALYAIRNHVQHSGLPVNAYSMAGSWSDDRVACCHSAVPFLIISKLKENPKISKKVINELENFGEQVDLRLLVRENMSAFCKIHKLIRNLVSDQAAEWDDLVQSSMAEFQKQSGEKLIGLYAQEIDARKNITNEFSLFDDMIKRRIYLASKNRTLTNVEKHFVTGEIKN